VNHQNFFRCKKINRSKKKEKNGESQKISSEKNKKKLNKHCRLVKGVATQINTERDPNCPVAEVSIQYNIGGDYLTIFFRTKNISYPVNGFIRIFG
jgi:hypothetical protein